MASEDDGEDDGADDSTVVDAAEPLSPPLFVASEDSVGDGADDAAVVEAAVVDAAVDATAEPLPPPPLPLEPAGRIKPPSTSGGDVLGPALTAAALYASSVSEPFCLQTEMTEVSKLAHQDGVAGKVNR